ncbi:Ubiquinone/menaquinone biosynthesis C-methylase UbiE [Actinopolyspora xinjiangensis]|uniref:Ubiquinone/menaquinone biosynthesis C-methylase UbiE n=1 Tax=Actinopolyspora xinjiangensis TaxID=405564 RepID=A0A1H0WNS8_9ACTN|nr:class I SAM-dependent methyltransferase [Actinopolyspora xinjiangensis]SDP92309.1 Ubiquinone/menaquinone biosynthesis C-methylase UbiE [Actinopolyspora xinjiangensis]
MYFRYPVVHGFEQSARQYDRLVGLNPGYHRALELSARRLRLPDGGRGLRLLDAGCGTGASTAALLRAAPHARVVATDASANMLARARRKEWPDTVEFVHAPLEELERAGVRGPFDGVMAAYLLRNLSDPDSGLRILRESLRPGARLALHEFSVRRRPLARLVWTAVCWSVIIPAGELSTRGSGIHPYLWRSVLRFDSTGELASRMRRNGLVGLRLGTMPGWQHGIVHTVTGQRPGGR